MSAGEPSEFVYFVSGTKPWKDSSEMLEAFNADMARKGNVVSNEEDARAMFNHAVAVVTKHNQKNVVPQSIVLRLVKFRRVETLAETVLGCSVGQTEVKE